MKHIGGIVGLVAFGAAVLFPPSHAVADDNSIVQISAVLASKDRRFFDPRLKFLRNDLRSLPYRSYTLLDVGSCRFLTGDQCAMEIPGGGYLQIRTTESTRDHLKMRLLLIQGNRPILNADVKLNRNAGILLRSTRTESGTVILHIKVPDNTAIDSVERHVASQ